MIAAARVASAVIPRAATSARPAGTFLVATGACLPAALPRRGMSAAAAASPPWVTPGGQLGVDEDEDYIVFPRQRPGKDYMLNWSLNRDGVTPRGDAYRFTKAATAVKALGGKKPKALPKKAAAAPLEAEKDDLSFDDFDAQLEAIVERFEAAGLTLYVAEGDAPGTRTPSRVITDSLELGAGAMCLALERMPLREAAGGLPVTVFAAPDADAPFAGIVYEASDSGETQAKVVLTGASASPAGVLAAVNAAAAGLAEEVDASA